jgi:SGNH hydrolase-like domain, acetyltransferase AlgX
MSLKKINNLVLISSIVIILGTIISTNYFPQLIKANSNSTLTNNNCDNIIPNIDNNWRLTFKNIITIPTSINKCLENSLSLKENLIKYKLISSIISFNQLPVKNFTIEKNKWLFRKEKLLDEIQSGKRLLTPEELTIKRNSLIVRAKYYKENNIKFLIVHVPFKNAVYNEQLNNNLGYAKYTILNQMEELIKPLQEQYDFGYYNLKKEMLEAKDKNRVFFTNDSHWNYEGMKLAYNKYYQYLTNIKKVDFKLTPTEQLQLQNVNYQGDIPRTLGIPEFFEDKNQISLNPISPKAYISQPNGWIKTLNGETVFHEQYINTNPNLPRLSIYADSFTDIMRPILAEDFSILNYYKNSYPGVPDEVYKDKPDVVLEVYNEGYLGGLL